MRRIFPGFDFGDANLLRRAGKIVALQGFPKEKTGLQ
jgi:hypothetical protein